MAFAGQAVILKDRFDVSIALGRWLVIKTVPEYGLNWFVVSDVFQNGFCIPRKQAQRTIRFGVAQLGDIAVQRRQALFQPPFRRTAQLL